jgi:preprotein translocase subunit SecF
MSSATKSKTPFERIGPLSEEHLSAGVEYQGGFGVRLQAAAMDSDDEAVELDALKVELAERKEQQTQREQEIKDMLESKLESSKEETEQACKAKDTEPNLPTTVATVETEPAAEADSENSAVWCCGRQRHCELM